MNTQNKKIEFTVSVTVTEKEISFLKLLKSKSKKNEVKISSTEESKYDKECESLIEKGIITYFMRLITITNIGKQICYQCSLHNI